MADCRHTGGSPARQRCRSHGPTAADRAPAAGSLATRGPPSDFAAARAPQQGRPQPRGSVAAAAAAQQSAAAAQQSAAAAAQQSAAAAAAQQAADEQRQAEAEAAAAEALALEKATEAAQAQLAAAVAADSEAKAKAEQELADAEAAKKLQEAADAESAAALAAASAQAKALIAAVKQRGSVPGPPPADGQISPNSDSGPAPPAPPLSPPPPTDTARRADWPGARPAAATAALAQMQSKSRPPTPADGHSGCHGSPPGPPAGPPPGVVVPPPAAPPRAPAAAASSSFVAPTTKPGPPTNPHLMPASDRGVRLTRRRRQGHQCWQPCFHRAWPTWQRDVPQTPGLRSCTQLLQLL